MASIAVTYWKAVVHRRRWTVLTPAPILVTLTQWLINHFSSLPADLKTASIWQAPWWIWMLSFLACFSVAQFLAWREEYTTASMLEAELRDQRNSQFEGQIVQVNHHAPPIHLAAMGYSCSVVIVSEIKNLGAVSILDAYKLTIAVDGRERCGDNYALPDTMTLQGTYGVIKYFNTDALYRKTMTPIPRGGKIAGVLWFLFKDITPSAFDATSMTLCFSDVRGKRWSIKVMPGEVQHNVPLLVPGVRMGVALKQRDSQP